LPSNSQKLNRSRSEITVTAKISSLSHGRPCRHC